MENKKEYVTQLELERSQNQLRTDLKKEIGVVDDKVDSLRDIVLPMVEASKQTATNTKKIGDLMERFTDEQRRTNGKFHEKFNQNDVTFAEINGQFEAVGIKLSAKSEEKSNNTKLILGVLSGIVALITLIFQAAPNFFN